ncbi:hypothetical protein EIP91_012173 [Steccherinum ochraceum]|uniref:Uncharacterized protein n=1 Tax=Steccherinum ochraceum TaxID=92696 RepID=A0A4R0RL41_9APHY|nr:hypothetical protein EIP91_012173 [Steccherinum ochraceum]
MGKGDLYPAWQIYAEQLARRGHGHAMWYPEAVTHQEDVQGEPIEVGDVGYFQEGIFKRIFNAFDDQNNPKFADDMLDFPPDFEPPVVDPRLYSHLKDGINKGLLASNNAVQTNAGAGLGAGTAPLGGKLQFDLQSSTSAGAVLVLRDGARMKKLARLKPLERYVLHHHLEWYQVTQGPGVNIKPEDIIFVFGYYRTKAWAVSAWQAASRHESVTLSLDALNVATANIHASHGIQSSGSVEQRSGPANIPMDGDKINWNQMEQDQTVFIHYYKVVTRLVVLRRLAAHGDEEVLPDAEDGEGRSGLQIDSTPDEVKLNDPVDALLDYIILHSDAEFAIASTWDLEDLFGHNDWPENVAEYLNQQLPTITVERTAVTQVTTEDPAVTQKIVENTLVGSLSLEESIKRQYRRMEQAAEAAADAHATEELVTAALVAETAEEEAMVDAVAAAIAAEPASAEQPEAGPSNSEAAPTVEHQVPGEPAGDEGNAPPGGDDDEGDDFNGDNDRPAGSNPAASKVIPDNLRGATIIFGNTEGAALDMDWPHKLLYDNEAEGGAVCTSAVSMLESHIAAGFEDHIIRVWELATGTLERRLEGHIDTIWGIAYSPTDNHKLASGSGDKTVIIWDTLSGERRRHLGHEHGDVWSVAFTSDGTQLASGATDGKIRLWDSQTGALLRIWQAHPSVVMYLEFSPDGNRLLSGSDSTGTLWNPHSGEQCGEISVHDGIIWCMAFSPDGTRILTGGEDKAAHIWSAEDAALLVDLYEHTGAVWSLAWSPDGEKVVTGSFDQSAVISGALMGNRLHVLRDRPAVVSALAWSTPCEPDPLDTDARRSSKGKEPVGRRAIRGKAVDRGEDVWEPEFAVDEGFIAGGTSEGAIKFWTARKGTFIAEVQGHKDKIKTLYFTKGGLDLVSTSDDGTVRSWNIQDILKLYVPPERPNPLAVA